MSSLPDSTDRHEDVAAQGHYESEWFGWCELCARRRLRIFWWVEDGVAYDTVCRKCRPGVSAS